MHVGVLHTALVVDVTATVAVGATNNALVVDVTATVTVTVDVAKNMNDEGEWVSVDRKLSNLLAR